MERSQGRAPSGSRSARDRSRDRERVARGGAGGASERVSGRRLSPSPPTGGGGGSGAMSGNLRTSRERRGDSSTRTRDTAESGTPHNDGFAAFMRAQQGRINAAADAADARRQLSAEWLKLTVSERREWRRRDADYHQHRSDVGRSSLGSTSSSRTAGSTTPPRATRRKSPSTRSKHSRRSATEEPVPSTPAASDPTVTPITQAAPVSVWTGRGSHLTPRNGTNGEDIEKLMMAEAEKAKMAKSARQRPKSAAATSSSSTSSREWIDSAPATTAASSSKSGSTRAPLRSVPVNAAHNSSGNLPEGQPAATSIDAPTIDRTATASKTQSGVSSSIPVPILLHDETVIFVDWDDTLLCTHELIERQNIDIDRLRNPTIPQPVVTQLRKLEQDCITMLSACMQLGTLIIVTNAAPGWIERSGKLCLPKLLSWIEFNNVEVVYARQKVEPHQAGDPTHWKPAAFSQALDTQRTALYNSQQLHRDHHGQLEEHEEHLPRINLLSIGDGIYERVAARVAASPQDLVKTLKFVDSPSIAQLRQQLKLATQMLQDVVASDHSRSLTLRSIMPENQSVVKSASKTASPAATPLESPGGGSTTRAAAGAAPTPKVGGDGGGLSSGLRRAKAAASRVGGRQTSARRRIDL